MSGASGAELAFEQFVHEPSGTVSLHATFTAAVGGPEGRAKQSEVGLVGSLGLTLGPRAGSLSPGPVGWNVVGRNGLRLRCGLGLGCLWGCWLLASEGGSSNRSWERQTLLLGLWLLEFLLVAEGE